MHPRPQLRRQREKDHSPPAVAALGQAIDIQADGSIVAAGRSYSGLHVPCFTLLRYTEDGNLAPAFGNGGIRPDVRWRRLRLNDDRCVATG